MTRIDGQGRIPTGGGDAAGRIRGELRPGAARSSFDGGLPAGDGRDAAAGADLRARAREAAARGLEGDALRRHLVAGVLARDLGGAATPALVDVVSGQLAADPTLQSLVDQVMTDAQRDVRHRR